MAVETGSDEEIAKINAYQDKVTITPLADWLSNGNKGIAQADRDIVPGDFVVPTGLPDYAVGQVDKQTPEQFYTLLNVILNDSSMPVLEDSLLEAEMLGQLKSIGIGSGLTFDWAKLTTERHARFSRGLR